MVFERSDVLNIFIIVIIILAVLIFIEINNIDLNPNHSSKKVVQVVNIEALQNNNNKKEPPNTSIEFNPLSDFCKNSSSSLKESCGKLTNKNCNATTCCIMLNGKKCVAGNQDGPTFKTESGKDISVDYYYYQNKCYGNNCAVK
jgi:hypothetical protein